MNLPSRVEPCELVERDRQSGATTKLRNSHSSIRVSVKQHSTDAAARSPNPSPFPPRPPSLPHDASRSSSPPRLGAISSPSNPDSASTSDHAQRRDLRSMSRTCIGSCRKFLGFLGPGCMVAVAYIDPGNYSTDVAAGASLKFSLLFIVLLSNIFAVILQSLAIRLGTVTGLNLAEHCRANFPPWLNILLYLFAEAAIVATDIAEVIGSAIALNLLLHIPLVAGCAITILDVLIILLFYRPNGSLKRLRLFEYLVAAFVIAVVVCFCIQMSLIRDTSVGTVLRGYIPSSAVVQGQGLYLSCGILGATVMPHSLYLGSGLVQPRLREYDEQHSLEPIPTPTQDAMDDGKPRYYPSMAAIRFALKYSTIELIMSLSIFALFVNSAILIVAGSSLSADPDASSADLFGVYHLLASSIAPAAATIFALALFFSGTSAGIVCTIAGQMVSEGQLRWTVAPWVRRLITRSISITPSIVVAGTVGQAGLTAALNATQVALSIILPFVSAPLIYFTCRNKYMIVGGPRAGSEQEEGTHQTPPPTLRGMRNHWSVSILAILVWLVIVVMNVALLVLFGMGID